MAVTELSSGDLHVLVRRSLLWRIWRHRSDYLYVLPAIGVMLMTVGALK